MAASPSHSDRPSFQGIRRSVTLPNVRPQTLHEKAGLDEADANEEVFYTHPSVKIFEFAPSQSSIKSNNKEDIPFDTDYPVDTIETLPWRSRTETLLASGRFTIEKVRGSGIFWKCQAVTRTIMKNSQTWCVDGQSKFVLRVRAFKYYRVELPSTTDDDKQKVEELKILLPKIQRYERTPCPFIRSFSVALPEDAITPRRKGTWKRRDSSQTGLSDTETISPLSAPGSRRLSTRHPPTSYPRKGPVFSSPIDNSLESPVRAVQNPSTLNEERASSPASSTYYEDKASDDDDADNNGKHKGRADRPSDSELQISDEIRGRSHTPRQVSASTPVSVRIASIERSKAQHPISPMLNQRPVSRGLGVSRVFHQDSSPSKAIEVPHKMVNEQQNISEATLEPKAALEQHNEDTNQTVEISQISTDRQVTAEDDVETVTEDDFDVDMDAIGILDHSDQPLAAEVEEGTVPEEGVTVVDNKSSEEHKSSVRIAQNTPEEIQEPVLEERVVAALSKTRDVNDQNEPEIGVSDYPENTSMDADCHQSVLQTVEPVAEFGNSQEVDERSDASEDSRTVPSEVHDVTIAVDEVTPIAEVDEEISESVNNFSHESNGDDDTVSIVSSTDSFHTMSSNINRSTSDAELDFDKTPVAHQFEPSLYPGLQHRREVSEMTVTASTVSDEVVVDGTGMLGSATDDIEVNNTDTPLANSITSDSSWPGTRTPIPQAVENGLRQRLRARRSFSPMPPASTIITNPTARQSNRHDIAKAVLQTVIFKPVEVAVLMIHVIARIAAGAPAHELLSGELFRRPEHRRRVSGFADQLNGNMNHPHHDNDDYAQEDDYGVPIRGRSGISQRSQMTVHEVGTIQGLRSRHDDDNDADSFLSVD